MSSGGSWLWVMAALLCGAFAAVHARAPGPARRLDAIGVRQRGVGAARPSGRATFVGGPVRAVRASVRRLVGPRGPTTAVAAQSLVEAWAAHLRVGRPVDAALRAAIDEVPTVSLPATATALTVGSDLGPALRQDASAAPDEPMRGALAAAAACATVAQRQGGRLAVALEAVAEAVRADELHRAHVRAQLAGPRATARLLAALPLLALAMSSGLGMSPTAVLLSSPLGRGCLVAGLVLDLVGLWWTARLARGAERGA